MMAVRFVCLSVQGGQANSLSLSGAARTGYLAVVLLTGIADFLGRRQSQEKNGKLELPCAMRLFSFLIFSSAGNCRNRTDVPLSSSLEHWHCGDI